MRIVITRASSVFFVDGVNTFIFELGAAMIKKGHDVYVVSGCNDSVNLDVSALFDVDPVPEIHVLNDKGFRNSMDEIAHWIIRGKGLLEKLNPDIVIMNGVVPCFSSIPQIAVCHGLKTRGDYQLAQKLYDYIMYRKMDSLVAVSRPLAREIRKELGIKNVQVIPVGLEIRKHRPLCMEERRKTILHVGTSNVKNLTTTLNAFQMVAARIPDAELLVVGDNFDSYKKLLKNSIRDRVHFLGLLTRKELMRLYSIATVVSAPSLYEAFPYVVLEAFRSGTPVIGSESVPKNLLVEGYNGYRIASSKDYKTFGNRFLELLSNASQWKHMSLNARTTAVSFDILKVADEYLDLIKEVQAA